MQNLFPITGNHHKFLQIFFKGYYQIVSLFPTSGNDHRFLEIFFISDCLFSLQSNAFLDFNVKFILLLENVLLLFYWLMTIKPSDTVPHFETIKQFQLPRTSRRISVP